MFKIRFTLSRIICSNELKNQPDFLNRKKFKLRLFIFIPRFFLSAMSPLGAHAHRPGPTRPFGKSGPGNLLFEMIALFDLFPILRSWRFCPFLVGQ